jgi:tetratricopeptide (TPR) repeat protein
MPSIFNKLLKRKAVTPPLQQHFDALFIQATGAAAAQDFQRAVELYDQAIALNLGDALVYYKRGNALKRLGRLDAAIASYNQAIEHKPDYAYAYCNRGVVQQDLGMTVEALSSYDQAIALQGNDAMAHYNRALLMQDCSRWDEVLAGYNRAIAIDPGFADAQYNRSLALLFRGDFENGWRGFEWRWQNAQRLAIGKPRDFPQPLWLGEESIAGKRLLLYSEGGLGDTLQFCRYVTLSAAVGATVLLEVQPPLLSLLANLQGVSQLICAGSALPPFDYQCPLMSLPLAFKTTLGTIPAAAKYLHSDSTKIAMWRMRLGERTRPRIGIVWSGNPNNTVDSRRSFALADWVNRLPRECQYFCVQKDVRPADRETLAANPWIARFDEEVRDFDDTAALCECLDLVISVDTSVAHLNAALGRPTWLLLPFKPDWRWLLDRGDSPWYPTVTLYRQKAAGDWNEVFDRIAADLNRTFLLDRINNQV